MAGKERLWINVKPLALKENILASIVLKAVGA
jgi:hypothetical protein